LPLGLEEYEEKDATDFNIKVVSSKQITISEHKFPE